MVTDRFLRLAVMTNGKVRKETLVRPPMSIVFGQKEPFPFDLEDASGMKGFTLFEHDGEAYRIRFTSSFNGVISTQHRETAVLDEFRSEFHSTSPGVHSISLKDVSRGHVTFGQTSVIFVLLDPPDRRRPGLLPWLKQKALSLRA